MEDWDRVLEHWTFPGLVGAIVADHSQAMSSVFVDADARNAMREMRRGEQLAPSARALMESDQRRQDALAPYKDVFNRMDNALTSLQNDVTTFTADLGRPILTVMESLIENVPFIKEHFRKKEMEERGAWASAQETAMRDRDVQQRAEEWRRELERKLDGPGRVG